MVIENVKDFAKEAMKEERVTYQDIGKRLKMDRTSAWDIVGRTKNFVNPSLVKFMEVLGYDIKLEFVPRSKRS